MNKPDKRIPYTIITTDNQEYVINEMLDSYWCGSLAFDLEEILNAILDKTGNQTSEGYLRDDEDDENDREDDDECNDIDPTPTFLVGKWLNVDGTVEDNPDAIGVQILLSPLGYLRQANKKTSL